MIGPVQVVVVGFDRPVFSGEVLAELNRLRDAGIVRLVDVLLVERAADGTFETLAAPDGMGADLGGLAAAVLGRDLAEGGGADIEVDVGEDEGDTPKASAWSLAQAVPSGSVAAVALIEHLWARPLTEAIRRAGGTPLEETWLAPGELETLATLVGARSA